jgi:hypothetical protein
MAKHTDAAADDETALESPEPVAIVKTAKAAPAKLKRASIVWTGNARRAMESNPDYFVWWYTVKSVGLAVAVATAAYYAGRAHGQREIFFQRGRQ